MTKGKKKKEQLKLKFPVGGETMARKTDPETSQDAAEEFRASGHLGDAQAACLEAVRRWQGDTQRELVEQRMETDLRTYATRFSELRRKGFIHYGEKRPCRLTGKRCLTVWLGPLPKGTFDL